MGEAVGIVERESYKELDGEANPGAGGEPEHEIDAGEDAEDGQNRNPGSPQRPRPQRFQNPQDDDAGSNEHEGRKGSDIAQVSHLVQACKTRGHAHEEPREDGGDAGPLASGVYTREGWEQQAVPGEEAKG